MTAASSGPPQSATGAAGHSLILGPYTGPKPLPPAFGKDADTRIAEIMGRPPAPEAESVYALVKAQEALARRNGEYVAPAEPRDLQAKLRKAQEGYAQLR